MSYLENKLTADEELIYEAKHAAKTDSVSWIARGCYCKP